LNKQAKEALEIAIIAEEGHRWIDIIEAYQIVIQKNYQAADIEKTNAFKNKLNKLKEIYKKIIYDSNQ